VPYLLRKMIIFGIKMYSIQVISHSAIFVKKNDHIWNINVFHTGNILQCHICNTKWPYLEHKMYFKLIKNVVNFPNTLYFLWKIYLYYGIEEWKPIWKLIYIQNMVLKCGTVIYYMYAFHLYSNYVLYNIMCV